MTDKIVLGIDLDQVCLDYIGGLRKFTSEKLNIPMEDLADPHSYSFFESGWGFTDEAHYRDIHGQAVEEGLYSTLEPMEGVSESLHRLSDQGYHLRIITNRFVNKFQHYKVVAQTAERLDTANIPYHDLCIVKAKEDIHCDVYFDDAPHNIDSLRAAGKEAVVFDASYNRHLEEPRVANWKEVEQYLAHRKA